MEAWKKWLEVIFSIEVVIFAALYGLFTHFVIYRGLSSGHALTAYALNLVFIIVMFIASRTTALQPGIMSPYLYTYISSVEYGVLLLIPLDKFIDQLIKDDQRILKAVSRIVIKPPVNKR